MRSATPDDTAALYAAFAEKQNLKEVLAANAELEGQMILMSQALAAAKMQVHQAEDRLTKSEHSLSKAELMLADVSTVSADMAGALRMAQEGKETVEQELEAVQHELLNTKTALDNASALLARARPAEEALEASRAAQALAAEELRVSKEQLVTNQTLLNKEQAAYKTSVMLMGLGADKITSDLARARWHNVFTVLLALLFVVLYNTFNATGSYMDTAVWSLDTVNHCSVWVANNWASLLFTERYLNVTK